MSDPKKSSGFTLVELIVVVTIIAIMATIGYAVYSTSQITARDVKRKADLKAIAAALEVFHQYNGTYPVANVSSNSGGTWDSLLNRNYMIVMPTDPTNTGTHVYHYIGAGAIYDLCALLENTQENVAGNIVAGGAAPCGGALADRFFLVHGP